MCQAALESRKWPGLILLCSGASRGQIQPLYLSCLTQFGLPYVSLDTLLFKNQVYFSYAEPDASGTGAVEDGFLSVLVYVTPFQWSKGVLNWALLLYAFMGLPATSHGERSLNCRLSWQKL